MKTKRDTEYVVNVEDGDGEILEQRAYASLTEARQDYDSLNLCSSLERWENVWGQQESGEWTLQDREIRTLLER